MSGVVTYAWLRGGGLAAIVVLLFMAFMWERIGGDAAGNIIPRFAALLQQDGFIWLAGFMDRLAADRMTQGMVVALLVLAVYALLQYFGTVGDRLLLRRAPNGRWPRFIRWLSLLLAAISGRPYRLHGLLSHRDGRALHFDYGRHVLMSPLRVGLWAFPVVGFLGTVIGISGAVAHLPQVLQDNARLNQLLANLHVAFDTTFVGLAASLFIMAFIFILDMRWDRNEMLAGLISEHMAAGQDDPAPRLDDDAAGKGVAASATE